MKKDYINPETFVIDLKVSQSILAGSTGVQDKEAEKDNNGFFQDASLFHDNGGSEDW